MAGKQSTQGKVVSFNMMLERETKGAVRYQEVDEKGQPVDMAGAKVGTLYIRKSAFAGGQFPSAIAVTIQG